MFFMVCFKFLYPNDIIHINILIIILIRKSSSEFIFMNNVNTEILPIKAPNNSLYNGVFLLNIKDTDNSNRKSKPKFNSNTRSKYIFMASPL